MTRLKLSLLASTLYLGLTAIGHAAQSRPLETMSVDPSDIYSVVATPIQGDTLYRLTVYKGKEETNPAVTVTHPLSGKITDIAIKDIDNDGQDELVVIMQKSSISVDQLHFDVFEFEGKNLSRVENYTNIHTLFSTYIPKID